MTRAVRFDQYGGVDVLTVVDVSDPIAGPGQVVVAVKAAGINPGEAGIREGRLHERFPATFPSGEGSDLAGVVESVGDGVSAFAPGDEVLGWVDTRSSHADRVLVDAANLVAKPAGLSWEVAGSLFVIGSTAWAAVRAVAIQSGDTVVVAGAAGGVGSLAVQLVKRKGALTIGLAGEANHAWLRNHGVVPVLYGDGVAQRIREAAGDTGIDAFIDLVGRGYVDLALELGVAVDRIDTIADFAAISTHGVKGDGSAAGSRPEVMAELAGLIAGGELEVPIARTYPLEEVADAYGELELGHTHGKIVLIP
jgi:NADPH:quinone reductase-like Zn-dependent oxidoreductase